MKPRGSSRGSVQAGSAPKFASKLTDSGVPFGGILMTAAVAVLGVGLNFVVPEQAFEIVLNLAALGTMAGWAAITFAHKKYVSLARQGFYTRPTYRAPLAPFTNWLTIGFLAGVIALMAVDYPVGTWTLGSSVLLIPLLTVGWFVVRTRVRTIAAERQGYTGDFPVLAERPVVSAFRVGRENSTGAGSTTSTASHHRFSTSNFREDQQPLKDQEDPTDRNTP